MINGPHLVKFQLWRPWRIVTEQCGGWGRAHRLCPYHQTAEELELGKEQHRYNLKGVVLIPCRCGTWLPMVPLGWNRICCAWLEGIEAI